MLRNTFDKDSMLKSKQLFVLAGSRVKGMAMPTRPEDGRQACPRSVSVFIKRTAQLWLYRIMAKPDRLMVHALSLTSKDVNAS
jgi:hypothetical protein